MKKLLRLFSIFIFILLAVILYTNWIIKDYAKEKTFTSVQEISGNKVGLVLGTSAYRKDGGLNLFFKYRIQAAVELFNSGKIEYILVSGDNAHRSYNEPRDFKNELVKQGIPTEKIFLDYAGFRTLDSVIRSKMVFGQEQITIISQKFQNERAIYLADKFGIKAVGFNAKDPDSSARVYWREYLAKTKAYFDVLLGVQPKFLGDPVEIK